MNFLQTGHFFGETNKTIRLNGITLTDTEYTHERVDWHFHENAYFTFILQGRLIEGNKKETYNCSNGSLLFHSWQEPHYNLKPEGNTRGFHIEFDKNCFADFSFDISSLQGSFKIENPDFKFLLYKIFLEAKISDSFTAASVQLLLFEIFGRLLKHNQTAQNKKPEWAKKLKEILADGCAEKLSLLGLANELKIHPVHLSRDFSKHFDCTFGEYVRKLRVEKSLGLLPNKNLSLTEIAYRCGFADQSHFLRCFKKINGVNPTQFRKILTARC
jgi:AraC family transcriptional regulator